MKRSLRAIALTTLLGAPVPAFAQGQSVPPEMMQMMMNMMQTCMTQMAEGQMPGMDQGMPMHGGGMGGGAPMMEHTDSGATAAYMDAMAKMDPPMMEGIRASDPDVAFVKGMIPHHQGAIDMARIVLEYGDDEQTKSWAARIIEAQEGEIKEMQEWLKTHGE